MKRPTKIKVTNNSNRAIAVPGAQAGQTLVLKPGKSDSFALTDEAKEKLSAVPGVDVGKAESDDDDNTKSASKTAGK